MRCTEGQLRCRETAILPVTPLTLATSCLPTVGKALWMCYFLKVSKSFIRRGHQSVPFERSEKSLSLDVRWHASVWGRMAERPVLVGLIPQTVVLDPGDQVSWISDAGNLRVEFDVNRCPFSSNVFQAPSGIRLLSGPARPGSKAATYKYRLWLNDQLVGQGEVILREK